MRELAGDLNRAIRDDRRFAYCRLVATRGSTPQKPGAAMLVYPDGQQSGTLGGGCVEAEVKRRALEILHSQQAQVLRFDLDQDYGWDDGLICGGRMEVLVDPVCDDSAREYYRRLLELTEDNAGFTEAIVVDETAAQMPVAAAVLFDAAGRTCTVRGDLDDERIDTVAAALRPLAERPGPYLQGGVSYLPLPQRCRLLIVGGGHVGAAVARLAATLDFEIWVVDDRPEYVTPERFPWAHQRISGEFDEVLPSIDVDRSTYALIVTRGHRHDQTALYHLLERPLRYLGMIGSRRKIRLIFERLQEEGCSRSALAKVYAPLGLAIGSRTVPEIAVSICAELVAHRNRLGNIPDRPSPNALITGPAENPAP